MSHPPQSSIGIMLFCLLLSSLCAVSHEEPVVAKIGMLFMLSTSEGDAIMPTWSRIASCGILAVNHINSRNTELVPGVQLREDFNVTYEMHNTLASPSVAVARTFEMMASGSNPDPVHAIVGPLMSASAGPVSLMAGIEKIPVMGYASTAPALSQNSMYKWFNRVIFSDSQLVYGILRTFEQMDWTSVCVLYQDDQWGSGIAEAVLKEAGTLNINVATAQKFTYTDDASIRNAVDVAKRYGTRIYVFAVLEEAWEKLFFAAEDAGIAGPGFVWVNTGTVDDPSETISRSTDPSRLQRLVTGVLDVRVQPFLPRTAETFNRILRETRAEDVYDPVLGDLAGLRERLLAPVDSLCGFVYDAVWAQALALSRVHWSAGGTVDGDEVLQELRVLDFQGATGRVVMDPETGDRRTEGINLVVKNWQPLDQATRGTDSPVSAALGVRAEVIAIFNGDWELEKVAEPVWAGGMRGWGAPMDGVCLPGWQFAAATGSCGPCPAGSHSHDGLGCLPCPLGTHAPALGMTACDKCPRTAFGNASGLVQCFACPVYHSIATEFETGTAAEHCRCSSGRLFACKWGPTEAALLAAAVGMVLLLAMVSLRRRHADALWSIPLRDLHFCEPPEVLGRGTYGMVVAAEYRTTRVAVKRVIPSSSATAGPFGASTIKRLPSFFGGDMSGHMDSLFRQRPEPDLELSAGSSMLSSSAAAALVQTSSGAEVKNMGMSPLGGRSMVSTSRGSVMDRLLMRSDHAKLRRLFMKEMRMLSKMRHPCIVTVMGAVVERNCEPMLVMELMDHGSLYDLVHNRTVALNGELVIPILRHVASGLTFLHHWHSPIVHGDIKSANVLVDAHFRGKVADFGLSSKKSGAGTPYWMAPELLRGARNSPQSDVYALGITMWEVYARAEPYVFEDPREVLLAVAGGVAEGEEEKRPVVPAGCPGEAAAIMRQCWHRDPSLRPSCEEALRMLQILDVNTMGPEPADPPAAPESNVLGLQRGPSGGRSVMEDMFPKHVAKAILRGEEVPEDRRECATVLFSDIVGFTSLSSALLSHQVSDLLHRLFTKLDALAEAHGVYKLETIGDCYIAVTNLVEKQDEDHAIRMARFALGLLAACRETLVCEEQPELGFVQMRCGFDTGPLVGAIVGTRHKKYTIFGNTVNTASRMESTGKAGRIQCTETSAVMIEKQQEGAGELGQLRLRQHGQMTVKGKGLMTTFFVEDADPQARQLPPEELAPSQRTLRHTASLSVHLSRPPAAMAEGCGALPRTASLASVQDPPRASRTQSLDRAPRPGVSGTATLDGEHESEQALGGARGEGRGLAPQRREEAREELQQHPALPAPSTAVALVAEALASGLADTSVVISVPAHTSGAAL